MILLNISLWYRLSRLQYSALVRTARSLCGAPCGAIADVIIRRLGCPVWRTSHPRACRRRLHRGSRFSLREKSVVEYKPLDHVPGNAGLVGRQDVPCATHDHPDQSGSIVGDHLAGEPRHLGVVCRDSVRLATPGGERSPAGPLEGSVERLGNGGPDHAVPRPRVQQHLVLAGAEHVLDGGFGRVHDIPRGHHRPVLVHHLEAGVANVQRLAGARAAHELERGVVARDRRVGPGEPHVLGVLPAGEVGEEARADKRLAGVRPAVVLPDRVPRVKRRHQLALRDEVDRLLHPRFDRGALEVVEQPHPVQHGGVARGVRRRIAPAVGDHEPLERDLRRPAVGVVEIDGGGGARGVLAAVTLARDDDPVLALVREEEGELPEELGELQPDLVLRDHRPGHVAERGPPNPGRVVDDQQVELQVPALVPGREAAVGLHNHRADLGEHAVGGGRSGPTLQPDQRGGGRVAGERREEPEPQRIALGCIGGQDGRVRAIEQRCEVGHQGCCPRCRDVPPFDQWSEDEHIAALVRFGAAATPAAVRRANHRCEHRYVPTRGRHPSSSCRHHMTEAR
eukprot:m.186929 g.186929  ORF g.186929 m.186929 type:complete len:567 (+) comp24780_c0_seq1:99-1799(+)